MSELPIPGDWVVQGGAVGLLGIVFLMVIMERLVPARRVRQLEKERDLWQSVALKAMGHADALLPAAQITTEITRSFTDATTEAIEGRRPT